MAATDPLLLPDDVLIIPVKDLSTDVRNQFACDEDDYVISRPRSRIPSRIIDAEAARLLGEFRTPKTIVDAIINYSRAVQVDPDEMLESAFPLLQHLYDTRLLVPPNTEEAQRIEHTLVVGASVASFEVLRCVQVVQDTEVYQVRSTGGELFALKIRRQIGPGFTEEGIIREASLLNHLDGIYNPVLRGEGIHEGRRYLIMDWCPGMNAWVLANQLRRPWVNDSVSRLLTLCCAILDAYTSLHAQGLVHSDVHPRNILIGDDGTVKIIDFGFARLEEPRGDFKEPLRGGIGFFYEPEYARARRLGVQLPISTKLGEQYAVGVLLYLILTGKHYLDFSLEEETLFRQIEEDKPLPFSHRGIEPWPEVESVLARALSKKPADRFSSVEEFVRQLRRAGSFTPSHSLYGNTPQPVGSQRDSRGADLVQEVIARLEPSECLLPHKWLLAPTCSVNFGAAGIAYMFYRLACLRNDPQFLFMADQWVNWAKCESETEGAFLNPDFDITDKTVGPISLYHTEIGVHCVQALISQAMGNFASVRAALKEFAAASRHPCGNLDLTLGRSSTLIGCALLLEALLGTRWVDTTPLVALGEEVLRGIRSEIEGYESIRDCTAISFLGIAHGWAGILYAIMRWSQASGSALPESVAERLQQLAEYAEPAGRGLFWRRRPRPELGDETAWVGWCHGSAGYVHMWTLAHHLYGDERFLSLAQKAAWNTWENAHQNSCSLCCGLAGQAYALLNLYKSVEEKEWLERAWELGRRAFSGSVSLGSRSNSLYKGDVGIAILASDLSQPESSCMPLFEAEGWPVAKP